MSGMKLVEKDLLLAFHGTVTVSRTFLSFLGQLNSHNKLHRFVFEFYFEIPLHKKIDSTL